MAINTQQVNIGAQPNDGTGDPLRDAMEIVNQNSTEVQSALDKRGDTMQGPLVLSQNPVLPLEAATRAFVEATNGLVLTTLGDTLSNNGTINVRIPGNITVNRRYYSQTGNGSQSDLPEWSAITAGDVSGLALSATINALNADNISVGTLGAGRLIGAYGNITGVGTLTTGVWNATTIGIAHGGTGATDAATALANLGGVSGARAFTTSPGSGLTGGGDFTQDRALSLTATGVAAATYGSASSVGTFTVDAQGRLTAAASVPIQIDGSQVTGSLSINAANVTGTVAIANGGTGGATIAAAQGNLQVPPRTRAINTGTGLTGGGDLQADRTISLTNTTVTPGTYSMATLTVDAQGRLTAASSGSGSFVPTTRQVNAGTGLTGGGPLTGDLTLSLANTAVAAASYGDAATVGTFTVNAQGQLTAAANAPIAISAMQITSGMLAIAQGGTGANTAAGARTSLAVLGTAGGSMTGAIDMQDNQVVRSVLRDTAELTSDLGSGNGARTLDCTVANSFRATSTGNTTWTFSNPPASPNLGTLFLTYTRTGAFTDTWPLSVVWDGGSAPSLPSSGTVQILFTTIDGGTIWRGREIWRQ